MKSNGGGRDVKIGNGPPRGVPWVWLTRELLGSDAWRSMSPNAHRLVDFLLLEHMGKGGTANGKLKAPYRQLEAFGISKRLVTACIEEVESLGLVRAHRGGRRVATMYRLTWFSGHDGSPATNEWKERLPRPVAAAPAGTKIQKSGRKSEGSDARKSGGRHSNLPADVRADGR